MKALDDIRFELTERGTRIRYTAELRLRGPLRLGEPLLRSRFEETGRRAMQGIRAALERPA